MVTVTRLAEEKIVATNQTNTDFYNNIAAQCVRDWAVVVKLPDGSPNVVSSHDDMDDAITAVGDMNTNGAEAFVIYTPR